MTFWRLFAFGLALIATDAAAQEQGEAARGRVYAEQVCGECHAVGPEGGTVGIIDAASFRDIANKPGMSAMAIATWMQSEHTDMPHIVPEPDEINDVVAYIVSLKKQ